MEGNNQRTEIIENRLHSQEQSHLDLVETVKELQKQVHQQAEKLANAEDRSRRNYLRIMGIPYKIDSLELQSYFQTMVKSALPTAKNTDLLLDRIHRLPKPGNAPAAAPKDVIVRFHYYHIKEEFLGAVPTSGLTRDYSGMKVFQDFSAQTMRRRREFQLFTAELRRRGIRYRWGFTVKVLFLIDGRNLIIKSPEEGMELINSMNRCQVSSHRLSPSTPMQASKRSKSDTS
ncbi:uncharacterized protein LOC134588112 [Pelobates fuscus]|uniref:uncharacterized protein LOC134588112 n=1 Tax=Pelobates fuscus TaxID=191477 RepID=UPI002FE46CEA